MRGNSILILGRGYTAPARFPRCDVTWTTLRCVNDDPNILRIPNLLVWDTGHNIPNPHGVELFNVNEARDSWQRHIDTHGHKFANQYCWMLADIASEGSPFASVTLFGMNMTTDEHHDQAQYMTYFLGYARAQGVSLTICEPSSLLRPQLYGLTTNHKENV